MPPPHATLPPDALLPPLGGRAWDNGSKLRQHKPEAAVPRVTDTLMVADGTQIGEWGGACSSTFWCNWTAKVWDSPGNLSDDSKANPNALLLTQLGTKNLDIDPPKADSDATTGCGMPRYRHSEGLNVVWADGHARWACKGTLQLYQFHFATQNRLQ